MPSLTSTMIIVSAFGRRLSAWRHVAAVPVSSRLFCVQLVHESCAAINCASLHVVGALHDPNWFTHSNHLSLLRNSSHAEPRSQGKKGWSKPIPQQEWATGQLGFWSAASALSQIIFVSSAPSPVRQEGNSQTQGPNHDRPAKSQLRRHQKVEVHEITPTTISNASEFTRKIR